MNKQQNILIAGDSFAADWSLTPGEPQYGWPTLLSYCYNINNVAKGGVGEYKILQQLKNQDLSKYSTVIIAHTSPTRCHTKTHPIHSKDSFHDSCDLLYSDIEYHNNKISNFFNFSLRAAKNWFVYHYDPDYQQDIYWLIRNEINRLLIGKNVIELKSFDVVAESTHIVLDYSHEVVHNQNYANHYTPRTNKKIFDDLLELLE